MVSSALYDAKHSSDVNRLREIFDTQNVDVTLLVRNQNTPTDVLSKIVDTTNNQDTVLIICEHPNADSGLLTKIWEHPKWDNQKVKVYVVSNENCPEKFFTEMVNWCNPKISYFLAMNEATPTSILATMLSLYETDERFGSTHKSAFRALYFRNELPAPYTDWPLEWIETHFGYPMNPYASFKKDKK